MADVVLSSAAIRSAALGYLKDDYTVHGLTDNINREAEFFGVVRRSGKEVRGKNAIVPLLLRGNRNAVGARSELDDLPTPAFQQTAVDGSGNRIPGQIGMRHNSARMAISEVLIQASMKDQGAFESGMELETQGLTRDMAHDLNRQHIAGDGSGTLCVITNVSGAPTYEVEKPGGQTCWPTGADPDGAKFLEVGDVVAIYSSGGTFRGQDEITGIDYSTTPNEITLAGSVAGTVATDLVVKASKAGATGGADDAHDDEVEGLLAWIDDASAVANVDPSDAGNEIWVSPVLDFSAAPVPLSENILNQMRALVRRRGGRTAHQGLVSWTTYALELDYGTRILTPDKRYSNTTTLRGGYTALTYAGSPIMVDKDCLPGHWWMLTMSELYCYNQGGFYWMDRDSQLERIKDKMGWEATLLFFSNFGTPRRNIHGVVRGLEEPNRVDLFN